MPFKSEKQRRLMWSKHPKLAREWTNKYGSKPTGGKVSPEALERRLQRGRKSR